MNEQTTEQVNSTKLLGVIIDEQRSWKYHVNHVAMKISKMTGIMTKGRHYLHRKTLLVLYNTMINTFLIYCNTIRASTYATRAESISRIQKKIVRIVTFSNFRDDSRPLFESLKLLDIYKLKTCLTSCILAAIISFQRFSTNENIHSYNTLSKSSYTLNLVEGIMASFL